MSRYLMLEDHYINGQYLSAGTQQSTVDVGGLLPTGWVPTPNVDPLDTPAVAAFYAAGPARSGPLYARPVTYWVNLPLSDFVPGDFSPADFFTINIGNSWGLTGLGTNQSLYPKVNI